MVGAQLRAKRSFVFSSGKKESLSGERLFIIARENEHELASEPCLGTTRRRRQMASPALSRVCCKKAIQR